MVCVQQGSVIGYHPFFLRRDHRMATSGTLARPLTPPTIISSSSSSSNSGNNNSSSLTEVIPGLFVGNVRDAARVLSRDDHDGITHVLSLASSHALSSLCTPLSTPCPAGVRLEVAKRGPPLLRMVMPLQDVPEENILPVLQPCFDFIDEGRRRTGGKVLVHCLAGISRSAAIVTAYLMRTFGLSLDRALHLLNERYDHKACPNPGFLKQLQFFETQLLGQKLEEGEKAHTPRPS